MTNEEIARWVEKESPRMRTPVLFVNPALDVSVPGVRIVRHDSVLPSSMYLIDGETYCVDGKYPYASKAGGVL